MGFMIMGMMMVLVFDMKIEALDGKGWFVCAQYVGDIPNLSKGMVCGAVAESVISVYISDISILGWIGVYLDGAWVAIGFC